MDNLIETLVKAIQNSPDGIAALETLESLRLCNSFTLKTALSRLNKSDNLTNPFIPVANRPKS